MRRTSLVIILAILLVIAGIIGVSYKTSHAKFVINITGTKGEEFLGQTKLFPELCLHPMM